MSNLAQFKVGDDVAAMGDMLVIHKIDTQTVDLRYKDDPGWYVSCLADRPIKELVRTPTGVIWNYERPV